MLRRRLAIAGTAVALALGTVGVGSAGAGPSDENRLCNLESVQSFMSYFWGAEVNHGRCMKISVWAGAAWSSLTKMADTTMNASVHTSSDPN